MPFPMTVIGTATPPRPARPSRLLRLKQAMAGRLINASKTVWRHCRSWMTGFGTILLACLPAHPALAYEPQTGDIVFHTSTSSQSKAVQAATRSPYSHMGVVLFKGSQPFVFEAVQPVQYTPLQAWLDRGQGGRYVIKRPKAPLTPTQQTRLAADARNYVGKPYDLMFEWSNTRIYCSELVWKLYDSAAGIRLAPLARLGSFDLRHPAVQAKLNERYGSRVPLDEPVISPQAIFDSPLLTTVSRR